MTLRSRMTLLVVASTLTVAGVAVAQQPQPQPQPRKEQKEETKPTAPTREDLEPTERVVLQLLMERPRTSIEIKTLVKKSREHSARLMKTLFERRLVSRADQKKPFVYELTEEGRRYLSGS